MLAAAIIMVKWMNILYNLQQMQEAFEIPGASGEEEDENSEEEEEPNPQQMTPEEQEGLRMLEIQRQKRVQEEKEQQRKQEAQKRAQAAERAKLDEEEKRKKDLVSAYFYSCDVTIPKIPIDTDT